MDPRPLRSARKEGLFASWLGFVAAAASAVVVLWFLQKIVTAILLLFFALVVTIALTAPVRWFMRRGLSRHGAAVVTLLLFVGTLVLLGALVVPRLASQLVLLVNSIPDLIARFNAQMAALLERYPELQTYVQSEPSASDSLGPVAMQLFRGVGGLSLSIIGAAALLIIFLSFVIYALLDPMPIVRGYLASLPARLRRPGARAYMRASRSVVGWTKASLIVGLIEAVLAFIFLTLMEVPGALVWAALAFFAEFIPRIGGYVMAFPPVLVALTMGPMTALWVALFYLAMNEILGNFVATPIRGTTMKIHPVMLLFFTLAFALAFGVLGALVATPAAAFFSAYYSEFYLKGRRQGPDAAVTQC